MSDQSKSKKTAYNKPLAYMAADANTQAPAFRKNSSDYPQCSLLDTATNASAKTLGATQTSATD